jgi:guanylate kinase
MVALPGLVNNIVGNVVTQVQKRIRKRGESVDSRKSERLDQIIEEDYDSGLLDDVENNSALDKA